MTRTARAMYPRAMSRDRSVAKNGLDASMKKGGSGQHSWGSLGHEYEYERDGEMDAALEDGQFGDEDEARDRVYFDTISGNIVGNPETSTESDNWSVDGGATAKVTGGRIRSSSTASNPGITDDERARARKFRTGSFNGSRTVDLASIARTSVGVSASPPGEFMVRPPSSRKNSHTVSV